ncbi:DUF2207 domain-containing protein [Methylococcus geothermalis]|uniref:DUF2207 domain-containing protein n=1 Tax=Methylococcus geothermalis TaxID=2681310 RepID=A0A858Q7V6_9GAMM|nr:DUF2207 domain-containing protein [Methylococcus geothermalis]QJD29939.1 DUF2207 domain-containing protein [Methylococcus geothermalis]
MRWAILVFAWLVGTSQVQARSLVIQSFHADIVVGADGGLDVTETIRPRFEGSWNGIYRSIPVEYTTPQGFNDHLFLDLLGVTDQQGVPLKVEDGSERHYRKFKIWIPGAEDVAKTVMLHYRVRNGLKFFDDHDELYWNITGDEWEVPIEAASAHIVLPSGAEGIRTLAFTGGYGSREEAADVQVRGREIDFRMRRPLAFHEGLTAVVGWNKGVVQRPGAMARTGDFLRANWPLGLPLVVLAAMYRHWSVRGRDPRLRPIAPQYRPPEGLTPAELGTLIDNAVDMRDITATLVDLAVKGYVLIEKQETDRLLGIWKDTDYLFRLRQPPSAWNVLHAHERALLSGVFSGGVTESVRLSDMERTFYTHVPGIRDKIFDALMAQRYFAARPDRVRRNYMLGGLMLGVVWFFGAILAADYARLHWGMAAGTLVLPGLISAAIVAAFGYFMPARTLAGTRVLEAALGFEDFLAKVEADRMDRMIRTPDMFEKLLPYAMALGLEKRWAAAFAGICTQPPAWYRGGAMDFDAGDFARDLGRMATQAAAAMSSAPRSSGGSGFSGGSSGGGFGGGGGGGF